MNATDEILGMLAASGQENYFGEPVTQLEHALQCAQLARNAGADEETIAAALLHDIGHLLAGEAEMADGLGAADHDHLGAQYLREHGFSERVAALVEGHVRAKRYLTATNPAYREKLSEASVKTLELQGGPMRAEEIPAFESDPMFSEKLRLRSWDEQAKRVDWQVTPLEEYRELLATQVRAR